VSALTNEQEWSWVPSGWKVLIGRESDGQWWATCSGEELAGHWYRIVSTSEHGVHYPSADQAVAALRDKMAARAALRAEEGA
jgi:hypothetical protein